jgi:hypothetical protein
MGQLEAMPLADLRRGDEVLDIQHDQYATVVTDAKVIADCVQVIIRNGDRLNTIIQPVGSYCSARRAQPNRTASAADGVA